MKTTTRFMSWWTTLSLAGFLLGVVPLAGAAPADIRKEAVASKDQDVTIKKKVAKKKKKKAPEKGWFPKLSLGFSTAMVHTHQVPGIENGLSFTIGGVLNGELKFRHYQHSWTTTLAVNHGWTKTPTVKPFIKSADEANLKSFYDYRFKKVKKLSVFAGLQLITALAPGDLVVSKDTDMMFTYADGTQVTDLAVANRRYRMTKAFAPLIFKQLVGAGVKPWESDLATLDVKLSLAGQEVWASGWAIQDDKATPEIELIELRNFQQIGLQFEAELAGKIKKRLVYGFRLELMYPFVTSIDTDLSGFDLLNTELSFKMGLKLAKWASLEYVFGAKKVPLIVNQWQVVNNLVLTLTANIL